MVFSNLAHCLSQSLGIDVGKDEASDARSGEGECCASANAYLDWSIEVQSEPYELSYQLHSPRIMLGSCQEANATEIWRVCLP